MDSVAKEGVSSPAAFLGAGVFHANLRNLESLGEISLMLQESGLGTLVEERFCLKQQILCSGSSP